MSIKNTIKQFFEFSVLMILSALMMASSFSVIRPVEVGATTDSFNATGTWTAPDGVTAVTIEAWGGGGGGPSGNAPANRGYGGGGGGAYSSSIVPVVGGNSYTVTVGSGGIPGSNGGDSWFNTSGTILAKGGSVAVGYSGGAGGASSSGVGTILYSGGAGGDSNGKVGGGGGGSASAIVTGGAGGAPTGGIGQGNGGDGGSGQNVNGTAGNSPGGAGGGGGAKAASASGASGLVTVTYIIPIISVTVSNGSVAYGILGNSTSRDTTSSDINNTQIATNDGNVAEDFNIVGQDSVNWTLASVSGNEQYVHYFCTTGSGSPDPCDTSATWSPLTTSYQTLSTNILATTNKRFDLKITTPTNTTATSQQSVNVIIQAVIH